MKTIIFLYRALFKNFIPKKNRLLIKTFFYRFYYLLIDLIYPSRPKVDYYSGLNNFGDILNFYLILKLTGLKIIEIRSEYYDKKNFFFIGSILQRCNSKSNVWGSGFISKESKLSENPKNIYCVRGPLTRDLLLEQGIKCPQTYGDPGLLLSKIYKSSATKKFKIGIVPHFVDKNNQWLNKLKGDSIKIIDIQNKNIESFIDSICECEVIFSSSLHGIITADSYGIPSLWIEFSDKVIGDGFKFRDYFMSVGKNIKSPIKINNETEINDLIDSVCYQKIEIDINKILESCPLPIKISS